jgi:hypothetical protein
MGSNIMRKLSIKILIFAWSSMSDKNYGFSIIFILISQAYL